MNATLSKIQRNVFPFAPTHSITAKEKNLPLINVVIIGAVFTSAFSRYLTCLGNVIRVPSYPMTLKKESWLL